MSVKDSISKYGYSFQIKLIAALLSDPAFVSQTYDILDEKYFDSESIKWIVKKCFTYFNEYKKLPTLDVLKVYIDRIEDELLSSEIINSVRDSIAQIEASDIQFVKTETVSFCKNQELKSAILQSVEFLKAEKYEDIKGVIDKALKVGISNDIGLDYFEDIDSRYTTDQRNPTSTGWSVLDKLLKGGLAAKELGVFVASSGAGKCVGPNTEIEIQYEQIGIDLIDIIGKEITVWLNPWDEVEVDSVNYKVHEIMNIFTLMVMTKKLT